MQRSIFTNCMCSQWIQISLRILAVLPESLQDIIWEAKHQQGLQTDSKVSESVNADALADLSLHWLHVNSCSRMLCPGQYAMMIIYLKTSLLEKHYQGTTMCVVRGNLSNALARNLHMFFQRNLGPVVQSVVSLKSSLRVILSDSIHNILMFFAEKMWVAFAMKKLLTFCQQKISAYLRITQCKF